MDFSALIARLQDNYSLGLPGIVAQMRMAPHARKAVRDINPDTLSSAPKAAVLALLLPLSDGKDMGILLMERSGGPGVHAGQISFPGGKHEGEETMLETALRETVEETGVDKEMIKTVGPLTPLYIPPSNFHVYPFVGYVNQLPEFKLSQLEVSRLLIPSVTELLEGRHSDNEIFISSSGISVTAPCFLAGEDKIWGATAMMISELLDLLKRSR